MKININANSIEDTYRIYRKKTANEILVKITFSFIFAFLMWVSANSFVYLPFTPVPFTMQVLTVLISPIFLGSYWAMLSQIEYISLGLAGLPVFSGFKSGFSALAGPTGGYIIGFVIASFVTGYIYIRLNPITSSNDKNPNYKDISQHKDILDNYENIDKKVQATAIACLCGLAVIYIFGYLHLLGYLSTFGINIGLKELAVKTFKLGVQPFIIIDLLKIMIIVNIQRVSGIKKLTA